MKTKKTNQRLYPSSLACFALFIASTLSASATVVVYENDFTDGFGSFYVVGTGGPDISVDNTPPLSGNTLRFSSTSATANAFVLTAFTPVTLSNPGDYIRASYDMRYYNMTIAVESTGPVLALLNSGGTYLTSNDTTQTAATTNPILLNDKGYRLYKTMLADDDLVLGINTDGPGSSNADATVHTTVSSGIAFTKAVHSIWFEISLAANGEDLTMSYGFDSYTASPVTLTGTDVLTYTFDELLLTAFGNGGSTNGVRIDNVLVISNIPEPSSAALLLSGIVVWVTVAGRRRLRR